MTISVVTTPSGRDLPLADRPSPARLEAAARVTAAARAELCQRPDELSLRAVARRAGLDPREVSRLVESREQLVANVMFELVSEAHDAVRPALEATAGAASRDRLVAVARAYRGWALAHPAELWTLLSPRRRTTQDRAASVRAMRWFYGPVLELFTAALAAGEIDVDAARCTDRSARLVHPVFLDLVGGLDARVVSGCLAMLTGLQGHLVLETCGQLSALFGDLDRAFDAQVGSLLDAAGVR
ncbi:TetR/AcrR family transcriptional regulator [Nocardioides lentus]|uniref:TetR/AcrR family transcriptional regulator n=1 Tax=Nocardioides lentus TaxID=338077 RepID=A0ABN2NY57_9ACTN